MKIDLRQVRAGSIGIVEISPTDPLSVLWTRIQELHDYPAETTRLVHMGKVLTLAKDGDAPASNLADVPVVVVVAKVLITKNVQKQRQEEAERKEQEQKLRQDAERKLSEQAKETAQPVDRTSDDEDVPICRICRGTENDVTGPMRLFKPCMCHGSMKYVHVGCLQEWRQNSVNSSSYFQCAQCGFKYNIYRPRLANYLLSAGQDHNHILVRACSVLALLLATIMSGFLCSWFHLDARFYDLMEWSPPWKDWDNSDAGVVSLYLASALDIFASGALFIGMLMFVVTMYSRMQMWYEMRNYVGIGLTLAYLSQGGGIWRLSAIAGLMYAYYNLYERFRVLSKRLLHWLGDRVIEVA